MKIRQTHAHTSVHTRTVSMLGFLTGFLLFTVASGKKSLYFIFIFLTFFTFNVLGLSEIVKIKTLQTMTDWHTEFHEEF